MDKIALIIATKDRPAELKRLLSSLNAQTEFIEQVIIVDSSSFQKRKPFPRRKEKILRIDYFPFDVPSTSQQRNFGMTRVVPDISWVGFLDDDVVFDPKAIEEMKKVLRKLKDDDKIGGLGFNQINHPPLEFQRFKEFSLVEKTGFYHRQKGVVLPTGFQTLIGTVTQDVEVEWLPSTAVLWKKDILANHLFDDWFSGYGYLEDLDFSYALGKKYKLMVIAAAKYYHFPAPSGRGSPLVFGRREVLNRIYFVHKHQELSLFRCYLALLVRFKMSLFLGIKRRNFQFWLRALGNLWGFVESFPIALLRHEKKCEY